METILELKNITHSYHNTEGETPALDSLSFSVKKGEFISIVGPSGCGKTTLLSIISGLIKAEEGTILLCGKPLKNKENQHRIHAAEGPASGMAQHLP